MQFTEEFINETMARMEAINERADQILYTHNQINNLRQDTFVSCYLEKGKLMIVDKDYEGDHCTSEFPISYMWDDNYPELMKAERDAANKRREAEKAQKEQEEKEKQKRKDLAELARLQKMYGTQKA